MPSASRRIVRYVDVESAAVRQILRLEDFHSGPPVTAAEAAKAKDPDWFRTFSAGHIEAATMLELPEDQPPERTLLRMLGLFRRVPSEPWFRVVAQVGPEGDELHFLKQGANLLEPRRSGPLYLYVNHAVIGLPFLTSTFCALNSGNAEIKIRAQGQ